jgi:hypothetical protein
VIHVDGNAVVGAVALGREASAITLETVLVEIDHRMELALRAVRSLEVPA